MAFQNVSLLFLPPIDIFLNHLICFCCLFDLYEENEKEWKEAFSLFDRNGEGTIKTSDLGTILRALGKCPTEAELKMLVSRSNGEKLDFEQFKAIISGMKKDNATAAQEIRDALLLFSNHGASRISTDQVKLLLSTMEDKLEPKDIEPILALADENGFLNVEKLVHALLS